MYYYYYYNSYDYYAIFIDRNVTCNFTRSGRESGRHWLIIATNFWLVRQTIWIFVTQNHELISLREGGSSDVAVTPHLAPVAVIIHINIIIIIVITFWGEKGIMFLVFCCKVLNTKKTNQHNVKWYLGRKRSCQPNIMFLISFFIFIFCSSNEKRLFRSFVIAVINIMLVFLVFVCFCVICLVIFRQSQNKMQALYMDRLAGILWCCVQFVETSSTLVQSL